MRLGAKVLLITLAIALGLAGMVIWVVTQQVTSQETPRARRAIQTAVAQYFDDLDRRHRGISGYVTLLLQDPAVRAEFDRLESDNDRELKLAQTQFSEELFGRTLQINLTEILGDFPVSFHVFLNEFGDVLVTRCPDEAFDESLRDQIEDWPLDEVLESEAPVRQYVWLRDKLYLAFAVPVRQELDGDPTHVYFVGYQVNDQWARRLLGVDAEESHSLLSGCFIVGGKVVTRAGSAARDSWVGAIADTAGNTRSQIEFVDLGERFLGESVPFTLPGAPMGRFVVASSLDRALAPLRRLQMTIAMVAAAVVLLAVLASRWFARLISNPVNQLVTATQYIARGEFDQPVQGKRRDEFGILGASINDMADGLKQRDQIKDAFGKFVDPRIAENLIESDQLGGQELTQSVLFSDLAGFTALSEKLTPADQVSLLNDYLGGAADAVTERQGMVDKFIGDAVVAFWGPPFTDDHAALSCDAALRFVEVTQGLADHCKQLGVPRLHVRVGIATGVVLVGVIGSASSRQNYTVMGDIVNLGSRLEGVNKLYGTQILVDQTTADAAGDAFAFRCLDRVRVLGREEPVRLHELIGRRDDLDDPMLQWQQAYHDAYAVYASRDWSAAQTAFDAVGEHWPHDEAAKRMALRCFAFMAESPGDHWDGVFNLDSK